MKALDIFKRLQRMDQLIRLKATGNPKEIAARLGISQSMMYNYLDVLRSLGGLIQYSRSAGSYEYARPVSLVLGYKEIDK